MGEEANYYHTGPSRQPAAAISILDMLDLAHWGTSAEFYVSTAMIDQRCNQSINLIQGCWKIQLVINQVRGLWVDWLILDKVVSLMVVRLWSFIPKGRKRLWPWLFTIFLWPRCHCKYMLLSDFKTEMQILPHVCSMPSWGSRKLMRTLEAIIREIPAT